jgi:hypothetical protein
MFHDGEGSGTVSLDGFQHQTYYFEMASVLLVQRLQSTQVIPSAGLQAE